MDKNAKIKKIFEDLLNKSKKDKIFIVILIGILLMVIALPVNNSKDKNTVKTNENTSFKKDEQYEENLTNQLEKILSCVEGIGKVKVMLNFKNTGEKVLAKDVIKTEEVEGDSIKLSNSETHIFYEDSNQEMPYVIVENCPEIEGVIVVCEGGDNSKLVNDITTAINSLLGVPVHRIKVMKML